MTWGGGSLEGAFAALSLALPSPVALGAAEEARLVRATRLGNRGAARRLYEAHVARVYRAARAVTGSDAEAEDATQDAFADALAHLDRYEARPGTRFLAWLVTLALNRARKRRAAAARTRPEGPAELASLADRDGADEGSAEDAVLRRRALLAALATLPARDREVVALFHGAELTADEVARATGLSAAAVRKICERRRRELLARLTGEEQGHG
jgi:RNA polymerase sigma-70 factor (ECF subfamily)